MNIREYIKQNYFLYQLDKSPNFFRLAGTDRNNLAELFYRLGYKIGAEIGVRDGEFSLTLFKKIPELTLYCVDPWLPYAETTSERIQLRHYLKAKENLKNLQVVWMKMISVQALKEIPNQSLDFVYIDAAHDYDNVKTDIIGWESKVKIGGIVSGHDYFYHRKFKIMQVVNEYVLSNSIQLYITGEEIASFFWIKENDNG